MKITRRQLKRIIAEKHQLSEAPAYRLSNYERKKNQSLQMLMSSIDSQIVFIEGQLMMGSFDYEDMFDWDLGHIAGLADTIDAAREKAAEEGVPFVEPDTSRIANYKHRGRPAVVSRWSMNENTSKGNKMKITKRQLKRIIAEEARMLNEAGQIGPLPSQNVYDYVHDEVLDLVGEFLTGYGIAQEYGNFSDEDMRGLEAVVVEAAKEAVGTALKSVGFNTKIKNTQKFIDMTDPREL